MKYWLARMLSTAMVVLALLIGAFALTHVEEGVLQVILIVLAAVLFVGAVVISIMFYRCPHCRSMLPRRGFPGKFCRDCGKNLDS